MTGVPPWLLLVGIGTHKLGEEAADKKIKRYGTCGWKRDQERCVAKNSAHPTRAGVETESNDPR
jgi:hypothetical protein